MNFPLPSTWTRRLAVIGVVAVAGGGVGYVVTAGDDQADRQAEVRDRGAEVMPFDLDRTTHVFTDLPGGGIQAVTANDPEDTEQIRLVREHLREEAAAFSRGDLSDPATIHGDQMPGLAALEAGVDRFAVRYADLPAGAKLTYSVGNSALVDALHAWFDAQVSDHGPDAEHG